MTENRDYGTVKIPSYLIEEIEGLVGQHGFKTRDEVVEEALRKYIRGFKRE